MKIPVIDNGGQWTHREMRVLKYLGIDTCIIPNTTPLDDIDADALVLSGGAPRINYDNLKLGRLAEYFTSAEIPILAICLSHQFMAMHFGGRCAPAKIPEFGKATLYIDRDNEIFEGCAKESTIWVSHNDEVVEMTDDFVLLGHSDNCICEAMAYKKKPFYGLQFHPEVEHTTHGADIFRNFVNICKR